MNTIQKIFIVWFLALSFMAGYNFYHNLADQKTQIVLEATYLQNKDRYDQSINEHNDFKADINYLKGRADERCTQK